MKELKTIIAIAISNKHERLNKENNLHDELDKLPTLKDYDNDVTSYNHDMLKNTYYLHTKSENVNYENLLKEFKHNDVTYYLELSI